MEIHDSPNADRIESMIAYFDACMTSATNIREALSQPHGGPPGLAMAFAAQRDSAMALGDTFATARTHCRDALMVLRARNGIMAHRNSIPAALLTPAMDTALVQAAATMTAQVNALLAEALPMPPKPPPTVPVTPPGLMTRAEYLAFLPQLRATLHDCIVRAPPLTYERNLQDAQEALDNEIVRLSLG